MQPSDDSGEGLVKLLGQLAGLFEKPRATDKGGRPGATEIHHVRGWLKVQEKIDQGHSQSRACKLAGVSRSRYYEHKESCLVKTLERVHEHFGPDSFWEFMQQTDWDKEVADIEDLPLELRRIMSGQKKFPGDPPPTLLTGKQEDK